MAGIGNPATRGPEGQFVLVARTQSAEEAYAVAKNFEMKGYETKVVRRMIASVQVFEVWVAKKPEVFQAAGPITATARGERRKRNKTSPPPSRPTPPMSK